MGPFLALHHYVHISILGQPALVTSNEVTRRYILRIMNIKQYQICSQEHEALEIQKKYAKYFINFT